jgi:Leucine-rich repeat (LRR) protein
VRGASRRRESARSHDAHLPFLRARARTPTPLPPSPHPAAFFAASGGPTWLNSSGWCTSSPVCEWHGITCAEGGFVVLTALRLPANNLTGVLTFGPAPPVGSGAGLLANVTVIDLSDNLLVDLDTKSLGPWLPAAETFDARRNRLVALISSFWLESFRTMKRLRVVRLDDNKLNGIMPIVIYSTPVLEVLTMARQAGMGGSLRALCLFPRLRVVDVSGNSFPDALPDCWGGTDGLSGWQVPDLEHIDISGNIVNGPLPHTICNLRNLRVLRASANSFVSGVIPPCLGASSPLPPLEVLEIEDGILTGPIPPSIANLTALRVLALSGNRLTGSLEHLAALRNLRVLRLDRNDFAAPTPESPSTTFPAFLLTGLPLLEELSLASLNFTGELPNMTEGGLALPNLRWLSLHGNRLACGVPDLTVASPGLIHLDLGQNLMSGPMPAFPPTLEFIDLSDNRILGRVGAAPNLFTLQNLRVLLLGRNYFQNVLPEEIWSMPSLEVFAVDFNSVRGTLPTEISAPLRHISLANNLVQGALPPTLPATLEYLDISTNKFDGTLPREWGNASLVPRLAFLDASGNVFGGSLPATYLSSPALLVLRVEASGLTDVEDGRGGVESPSGGGGTGGSRLRVLSLAGNNFTSRDASAILTGLAHSLPALQSLNLAKSGLRGSLPADMGRLKALQYLDLGANALGGCPPTAWRNDATELAPGAAGHAGPSAGGTVIRASLFSPFFPELRAVRLARNALSCNVSDALSSFSSLRSITYLDLSANALTGPILPSVFTYEFFDTGGEGFAAQGQASWVRASGGGGSAPDEDLLRQVGAGASGGGGDASSTSSSSSSDADADAGKGTAGHVDAAARQQASSAITLPLSSSSRSLFVTAVDGAASPPPLRTATAFLSLSTLNLGGQLIEGPLPSILPPALLNLDFSSSSRLTGPIPESYSTLSLLVATNCPGLAGVPCTAAQSRPNTFNGTQRSAETAGGQQMSSLALWGGGGPPSAAAVSAFLPCFVSVSTVSATPYPDRRCTCDDVASGPDQLVALDPSYDAYARCRCDAGSFGTGCSCTPCPALSASPAAGAQTVQECACPAGYRGLLVNSTAADTSPTLACEPCPRGLYSPSAGSSSCLECPTFSSTLGPGATAITDCMCTPGRFPSALSVLLPDSGGGGGGSSEPSPAPGGSGGDAFACLECPANTYKASVGRSECIPCPEGHFAPPGAIRCTPCSAAGITCSGGKVTLLAGWWSPPGVVGGAVAGGGVAAPVSSPSTAALAAGPAAAAVATAPDAPFFKCLLPSACTVAGDQTRLECAAGHEGPLCGSCAEGFGRPLASVCVACPDPVSSGVLAVLLLLLFLLYSGFLVWNHQTDGKRKAAVTMRILLQHVQVACLLVRYVQLVPPEVATPLTPLLALDVSTLIYFPAHCWLRPSFTSVALLHLFLPLLLVSLAVGAFTVVARLMRLSVRDIKAIAASAVVTLLFIIYPALVRWVAAVFRCIDVRGASLLMDDTAIECGSPSHKVALFIAATMILLYIIGIPAVGYGPLLALALSAKSSKGTNFRNMRLTDPELRHRLGFLYNGFRLPASTEDGRDVDQFTFLWFAVILARQILIIGTAVLLSATPEVQLVALLAVLLLFLALHLGVQPYLSELHNALETSSLAVNLGTVLFSLFAVLKERRRGWAADESPSSEAALIIVVQLGFFVVGASLALRGAWRYWKRAREMVPTPFPAARSGAAAGRGLSGGGLQEDGDSPGPGAAAGLGLGLGLGLFGATPASLFTTDGGALRASGKRLPSEADSDDIGTSDATSSDAGTLSTSGAFERMREEVARLSSSWRPAGVAQLLVAPVVDGVDAVASSSLPPSPVTKSPLARGGGHSTMNPLRGGGGGGGSPRTVAAPPSPVSPPASSARPGSALSALFGGRGGASALTWSTGAPVSEWTGTREDDRDGDDADRGEEWGRGSGRLPGAPTQTRRTELAHGRGVRAAAMLGSGARGSINVEGGRSSAAASSAASSLNPLMVRREGQGKGY